jgi:hypothetical protein
MSVWQELHAVRQSCHSWRNPGNRSFSAMLLYVFFLPVLLLAAVGIVAAIHAVRSDGYGGHWATPPRSHAYELPRGALR